MLSPEHFRLASDLDGWVALGAPEEAVKTYLALPPEMRDRPDALNAFAIFLWSQKRFMDCLLLSAHAIDLYPGLAPFWLISARCLEVMGYHDKRKEFLLKAAKVCSPDDAAQLLAITSKEESP